MTRKENIDILWHSLFDLLKTYKSNHRARTFVHLSVRYDEDLLNNVAELKTLKGDDLSEAISHVRAKLMICEATEMISPGDVERMQKQLDTIAV